MDVIVLYVWYTNSSHHFFICRDVRAKRLARYLQPLKIKEAIAQGPFIFSSLSTRHKKEEEGSVFGFFVLYPFNYCIRVSLICDLNNLDYFTNLISLWFSVSI